MKDQQEFLSRYSSENMDEISRSYYQYRAQAFIDKEWIGFAANLLSFLALIPALVVLLLSRPSIHTNSEAEAVNLGYESDLPTSIKAQYQIANGSKGHVLNRRDLSFLGAVYLAHPLSFYFLLKIAIKLSGYRYNMLCNPNVSAILTNSEYSFTSSVVTKYCRSHSILHINYMHGEKMFFIRDSFFEFDKCVVWDQHYVDIFTQLEANPNQFLIEPPAIKEVFSLSPKDMNDDVRIATYYMQGAEQADELEKIRESMNALASKGLTIVVRPHPRYSDITLLKKHLSQFAIDNELPISESINQSKMIVSKYSTVLYQAWLLQKTTVIDDISNKHLYNKLRELKYIMIDKKSHLLSEVVN